MNARILLMVIAIFGTSLVFSQNSKSPKKVNCEKKVLKQIKRNMNSIDVADYMEENHKIHVVLTCKINDNKIVEVVSVTGYDEKLNAAVKENLENNPVACKTLNSGDQFSFIITFKHLSF